MLEQCAQRVAKGRDALLPAYCTLCEVIHSRANLRGGRTGRMRPARSTDTGEGAMRYVKRTIREIWGLHAGRASISKKARAQCGYTEVLDN